MLVIDIDKPSTKMSLGDHGGTAAVPLRETDCNSDDDRDRFGKDVDS